MGLKFQYADKQKEIGNHSFLRETQSATLSQNWNTSSQVIQVPRWYIKQ
jgi:hypothetical protein